MSVRLLHVCTLSLLTFGRLKTGTPKSLGYPFWNLLLLHLFYHVWMTRRTASGLYSLVRRASFLNVETSYCF